MNYDDKLTVAFQILVMAFRIHCYLDAEKGSSLRHPTKLRQMAMNRIGLQTDNRKPKTPIETNRNPNRNYFFRVQTIVDERGNIVSAHYGKI